ASPYGLGINNNQFVDVLNGVLLRGASTISSFRPIISCTTSQRASAADPLVGIGTDINAWLSDLYVYNGNFIGNGNNFSDLDYNAGDPGVENYGLNNGFEYTGYVSTGSVYSPLEDLDGLFTGIGGAA